MQDFDGLTVIDKTGETVGKVEQTYDDDSGTSRFVGVVMGGLFSRQHRLVPVADATLDDDGLHVPFSAQVIEDSPDASAAGETLEGKLLESVRAFYRGGTEVTPDGVTDQEPSGGAVPAPLSGPPSDAGADESAQAGDEHQIGAVRDLGDVIEVPIIEERLVKQPVVTEVLRIRKVATPEQRSVEATLRKEEVDVIRDGDVVVHDDASQPS